MGKKIISNNQNGFTLLELLISLTILAIFIASFSPLLVNSYKTIIYAGEKSNNIHQLKIDLENKATIECLNQPNHTIDLVFSNSETPLVMSIETRLIQNDSMVYFIYCESIEELEEPIP